MEYTIKADKAGMDLILTALAELPYKVAKPVMDNLLQQFAAQEQAAGVGAFAPQAATDTAPAAAAAAAAAADTTHADGASH